LLRGTCEVLRVGSNLCVEESCIRYNALGYAMHSDLDVRCVAAIYMDSMKIGCVCVEIREVLYGWLRM
jgi:hypothetical protein